MRKKNVLDGLTSEEMRSVIDRLKDELIHEYHESRGLSIETARSLAEATVTNVTVTVRAERS